MGKRFDIMLFPEGKAKAFSLSYDDGVVQDRKLVEMYNRYQVKCTFNLGYGVLGYKQVVDVPGKRRTDISKVEPEEVQELYKNQEVGGHSLYHSDLTALGSPYAMYEILEDKKQLEKLVQRPLKMFAYPFGFFNEEVKDMLKTAGYKGARTVKSMYSFELPEDPFEWNPTCHHKDERLMDLADKFIHEPAFKPELFYVWGHGYEFDGDDNWQIMEDLLQYLQQGREEIWFASNGEILDYLEAFSRLEYSVDGSLIRNPSAMDLWMKPAFGRAVCLKAGTCTEIEDTPL